MIPLALVALACHAPAAPAAPAIDSIVAVLRGEAVAPSPTRADLAAAIAAVAPTYRRSRP